MSEEKKNVCTEEETKTSEPAAETETPVEEKQEEKKEKKHKHNDHEKVKELEAAIASKDEEIAKLKNAYAMAYADTENTRKRLQNENDQKMKYLISGFAKELLPVLDNCERALAQETSDEAYRKGVEMICSQLKAALAKEGVEEIEALNQPFDGNWHQAVMSETREGVEPGMVIEVLQKGYRIKDRILRAAMVKVSD